MTEEVASMNNTGVTFLEAGDLAEAARYFDYALGLSNDTMPMSPSRAQHEKLLHFSQTQIPPPPDCKTTEMTHIYQSYNQRDEYDEGMQTFSTPIRL
eukprot:14875118-Ditylum_brightwellii.AAC.1